MAEPENRLLSGNFSDFFSLLKNVFIFYAYNLLRGRPNFFQILVFQIYFYLETSETYAKISVYLEQFR